MKKVLDFFSKSIIMDTYLFDTGHLVAWLSLVERCVRDAEVASSNLVATTLGRGAGILGIVRVPGFFIFWQKCCSGHSFYVVL